MADIQQPPAPVPAQPQRKLSSLTIVWGYTRRYPLQLTLAIVALLLAAGVVLGAQVPIVLTSRADSVAARLASCAVAACMARALKAKPAKGVA